MSKKTKRIAILACKNTKEDLNCSSGLCFRDFNSRKATFAKYDNAEIAGMITCAGCPTVLGSDKLYNRVKEIAKTDIDAIHLTSCISILCPYKKKYESMLKENFPEIEIVMGTHSGPENVPENEAANGFKDMVRGMFNQDKENLDGAANKIYNLER